MVPKINIDTLLVALTRATRDGVLNWRAVEDCSSAKWSLDLDSGRIEVSPFSYEVLIFWSINDLVSHIYGPSEPTLKNLERVLMQKFPFPTELVSEQALLSSMYDDLMEIINGKVDEWEEDERVEVAYDANPSVRRAELPRISDCSPSPR